MTFMNFMNLEILFAQVRAIFHSSKFCILIVRYYTLHSIMCN